MFINYKYISSKKKSKELTLVKQKEEEEKLNQLTNEQIMKTQKERDNFLISEMRKRLDHYFRINVTQIGDMVPKIITNFLINAILVMLPMKYTFCF